jgi:NAD(P)-dependent dehydrogenase (short-subunit alcohol dehydrogenase family)
MSGPISARITCAAAGLMPGLSSSLATAGRKGAVCSSIFAPSAAMSALIASTRASIRCSRLLPTAQGEMQFATNHHGHFALAVGLHEALAAAGDARIVAVSSVGHVNDDVDFDDINFDRRPYDPWLAYGQSKRPTSCSPSGQRNGGPPTGLRRTR